MEFYMDIASLYIQVRHCRYQENPLGLTWGPRTIPDYELILIVEGVYQYIDSNGPVSAGSGDVVLIEPEIEHVFKYLSGPEIGIHACAHFDLLDPQGNVCLISQLDLIPRRKVAVREFEHLKTLFQYASKEFNSYHKLREEIVNTAIRLAWLEVSCHWTAGCDVHAPSKAREMIEYIRSHIQHPISRQDLAEHFSYTPEHVNYLFKKELGMTPSRCINRERAILAFKMINEQGFSIQQAAMKTGFSSQYYFSRVFKDIFGYPPNRIKKYINRDLENIYEKHLTPTD